MKRKREEDEDVIVDAHLHRLYRLLKQLNFLHTDVLSIIRDYCICISLDRTFSPITLAIIPTDDFVSIRTNMVRYHNDQIFLCECLNAESFGLKVYHARNGRFLFSHGWMNRMYLAIDVKRQRMLMHNYSHNTIDIHDMSLKQSKRTIQLNAFLACRIEICNKTGVAYSFDPRAARETILYCMEIGDEDDVVTPTCYDIKSLHPRITRILDMYLDQTSQRLLLRIHGEMAIPTVVVQYLILQLNGTAPPTLEVHTVTSEFERFTWSRFSLFMGNQIVSCDMQDRGIYEEIAGALCLKEINNGSVVETCRSEIHGNPQGAEVNASTGEVLLVLSDHQNKTTKLLVWD